MAGYNTAGSLEGGVGVLDAVGEVLNVCFTLVVTVYNVQSRTVCVSGVWLADQMCSRRDHN